jgi:hypothetical protein
MYAYDPYDPRSVVHTLRKGDVLWVGKVQFRPKQAALAPSDELREHFPGQNATAPTMIGADIETDRATP